MAHKMNRLLGILMMTVLLCTVYAQDKESPPGTEPPASEDAAEASTPPPPPPNKKTKITFGVIGSMESYLKPLRVICLQFLDSFLMHSIKMQLPCTVQSITPMKYTCTPLDEKQMEKKPA